MTSNDETRQTAYLAAQIAGLCARAAKGGVLYSDFLTLEQQKAAEAAAGRAGCSITLYGGTDDSQRRIAGFSKEKIPTEDFPIVILKASYDTRFLNSALSHRDFLGALMSLSIRREMIGDIVIGDGEAYLFVHEKTMAYVLSEFSAVRHASVSLESVTMCPLSAAPKFIESVVTVASMRLDCVVTQIMRSGRNMAAEAIRMKLVRVNDQTASKPDGVLREDDEISVKGYGKFRIGSSYLTKKGRIALTMMKYE